MKKMGSPVVTLPEPVPVDPDEPEGLRRARTIPARGTLIAPMKYYKMSQELVKKVGPGRKFPGQIFAITLPASGILLSRYLPA